MTKSILSALVHCDTCSGYFVPGMDGNAHTCNHCITDDTIKAHEEPKVRDLGGVIKYRRKNHGSSYGE